jgi:hypothetical protein
MKIGAWQQSLGNECVLFDNRLPDVGAFDEIWITTVFTFDIPYSVGMVREAKNRCNVVRVGGVAASLLPKYFEDEGVIVHQGLIPDAEKFSPDYDLLGKVPEYSISHTSRGCIRKCKFCMVPKLEPIFGERGGWVDDIHPGAKKILFFDNNWLAKDFSDLQADILKLRHLVEEGRINSIDFNQGLDARLVTEEIADLLQGIPIRPVRFAFDGMHEDKHYQRAIRLMVERGFRDFMSYVLYNFMDKPSDFYYRLRVSVELTQELKVDVKSFPMRYQPILDIDKQRQYIGKHWTLKKRRGFMSIMGSVFANGQVSCTGASAFTPVEEFEYWFGKSDEEFERLLTYPKLKQLSKSKAGLLRIRRAKAQSELIK